MTDKTNILILSSTQSVSTSDEYFDIAYTEHFWIKRRHEVLIKYFGELIQSARDILDLGCGSGIVIGMLTDQFQKPIDGIDLNEYALSICPKTLGQIYYYNILHYDQSMHEKYDLILLLDVLEHIEDDHAFLEAIAWHLKPDGKLILNLPMVSQFYSGYDKSAGHFRRYDIEPLEKLLIKAGYKIIRRVNWGYIYYPFSFLRKLIMIVTPEKMRVKVSIDSKPLLNLIMSLINKFDFETSSNFSGMSCMMLVSKPENNR